MIIGETFRALQVTRWHIVQTTRDQSMAEHSFMVAQISRFLVEALDLEEVVDPGLVAIAALDHDMGEIHTGDLTTPIKEAISEGISNTYDVSVNSARETVNRAIGDEESQYPQLVRDIVKAADLVDAVHFLKSYGYGKHAERVANGLEHRLRDRFQNWRWDGGSTTMWEAASTALISLKTHGGI